jgi:MATE family multidrug resistance protein
MAYTEPLLLSARHTTQTSPRHHLLRSRHAAAAAADGRMVVAVQDDETGALVAAVGKGDEDDDDDDAVAGEEDEDDDDAPVVRTARGAWEVFAAESRRLWAIGAPIAFNVICLYGTNSTTQIFVGHIGNRELSAVAIGLSVVSNFSFGFLVSPPSKSSMRIHRWD